ncbi:uncharacterized protein Tco025E_09874 [Trypanosoma conorhini]|uniref:Uncharacterized protein n=1 Tax=Trypanosoma conorhini TaxID=83891 RepID=A0A3R7LZ17_9TRYP|nr:uncharacterized protein Tco025E_09874 [Trypanosoma conorhini]RNE96349.1 hypothetical protein Tco025E_09874 [Trypanosoma conorhini]
MAAEVGMRARSATGTVVRWVALLLLLLQCLGGHPSFAAALEDGHVIVKIKRYFSFPNSEFNKYGGEVSYAKSALACARNGGYLSADQTPAAHQYITDYLRPTGRPLDALMFTFMGGDAEYSVNTQRCTPGIPTASLGCVYQWNQGAFADPQVKGGGASFYMGLTV